MVSPRAQLHPGWIEASLESYESFDGLWRELETAAAQGGIWVALLTGNRFGDEKAPVSAEQGRQLERFELPTIFAFDGALAGGAVQAALACDVRVCGPDGALRVPLGSRRALALLGVERSAELLPARGRVDAATALESGIVSHVAEAGGDVLEDARKLAAIIASRGPIAVKLAKEAIWRGLELPFEHALRFETDLTLLLQTTKDRAEGVSAFLEKRQPHFTGE